MDIELNYEDLTPCNVDVRGRVSYLRDVFGIVIL